MAWFAHVLPVLALLSVAPGCISTPSPAATPPPPAPVVEATPPDLRGAITFADVRRAVLDAHPDLAVHDWERRALDGAALQAGLRPNPSLAVAAENLAGTGDFAGTNSLETTVSLSQEFPLGGQLARRAEEARLAAGLTDWNRRERVAELVAATRLAFADVLIAQQQAALARENEALVERLVDGIDRRVNSGDVSPVARTKARVELATGRIERRRADGDLDIARTRLAALWGARSAAFETVTGTLEPLDIPSREAFDAALLRHPRLARWEAERRHRQAAVAAAEAGAWPSIEVGAGLRRFHDTDDSAVLLEVGLPLPLFDRNQGAIAEARAELARAAAQEASTRRELTAELTGLTAALVARRALADELAATLLPAAEATYEDVRKTYNTGQGGLLDLLDAERVVLDTRHALAAARADWHRTRAELEALLGASLDHLTPFAESH